MLTQVVVLDPREKVHLGVALPETGHLELVPGLSGPYDVRQPVVVIHTQLSLMSLVYGRLFLH